MRWALGSLLLALAHPSSSSARRNSRRMLISEAPTASEYVNVQEGRQGRQIQPLACVSKSGGEKGVCMFAWNCVEAGGQHLGTCIDRFYFGSCCKLDGNKPPGVSQGSSDKDDGDLAEDLLDNEIPDDDLVPIKDVTTEKVTTSTSTVSTTKTPPTTPSTSTTTATTTSTTTTSTPTTTTTSTTSTTTTTTTTTTITTTISTTTTTVTITTTPTTTTTSSSTSESSPLSTTSEDFSTTLTDEISSTTSQEELTTTDEQSTVTEDFTSFEETTLSPADDIASVDDFVFPTEATALIDEDVFSEDEFVTDPTDTDDQTSTPSAPQEESSTVPVESDTTTEDFEEVTTTEILEDVTTAQSIDDTTTTEDLDETTTTSEAEVTVVTEAVETTEEPVVIIESPDNVEFPQQDSADACKDNWVAVHIGPNGQPNAVGGLGGCVAKPGQYFNCSDTVISEGIYNCTVVDGPSPPRESPPEEEACRTLSDPSKIKDCLDSFSTTTTTTEKASTTPQSVRESNNTTTETPTTTKPTGWPDLSTMPFRDICGNRPWLNQTFRRSSQATPRGGRMIGGQRTTKEAHGLWGNTHSRRGKIVNGEDAKYGEWPWQVSLRQWRTATFLHKCGAALLSENWAITAAHCVESVNPDELLLRMGEFDLNDEEHEPFTFQDRKVQIVASHPKFDPKTFEYDLALLRFYEPVVFTPNIIPVCIPEDDEDLVGRDAWVTGWGRLYEDGPLPSKMQKVTLPIINNTECEMMYEKAGFREHIPHIFICAGYREGGKDSCEGDSGGPMSVEREDGRYNLAGIISWGIGCAKRNQPGVMTRIAYFRDWINTIIKF